VIASARFGQIEFATMGEGTPMLVSHGAGGGFDQVAVEAERLRGAGFEIVAPSRFGYLRSASPSDPSPAQQADAFAELLDSLRIQQVAVLGISAGALAALEFALRYPARCRSLVIMVPAATVAGGAAPIPGGLPEQSRIAKAIVTRVVGSDFLYWVGLTLAPDRMIRSVLATDPAVVAGAGPRERQRALTILSNVLPISERQQGLRNDAHYASTPQSIALEQIKAPTLVISLEDDFYRTLEPARIIAARIPGARLVTYPTGGHVWVRHDAEVFVEVVGFIGEY
jgi:pimeloyl-ACP methyl ester carboxylesterase